MKIFVLLCIIIRFKTEYNSDSLKKMLGFIFDKDENNNKSGYKNEGNEFSKTIKMEYNENNLIIKRSENTFTKDHIFTTNDKENFLKIHFALNEENINDHLF